MSSDPSQYGVVADGTYSVNYDAVGKSGSLTSHWAVEGRGKVSARGGVNPNHPDRDPGYLNGVFIHRSNNNGYAGPPVSKGCLLIMPSAQTSGNGWDEFNEQLEGVSNFEMVVTRDYVAPEPTIQMPIINFEMPMDNTYVAPPIFLP